MVVVFLVILLSSLIGGYKIAETLKKEAPGSSRTSVKTCGPHGVKIKIQTTTILLFVVFLTFLCSVRERSLTFRHRASSI